MHAEAEVGPKRYPDGATSKLRTGHFGELLVSDMNGFFYEQTMRGNGYSFSTAVAGNALVAATTGNAPAIWNPPQSGRNLVIQKVAYTRVAVGTPVEGGPVYLLRTNTIAGPATAADVVSLTAVAAVNLRADQGDNSGMRFAPTTIAVTTAPTIWAYSGISQIAATGTTTGPGTFATIDYINGLLVLPPGNLFSIGATAAIATTYAISIFGFSLPVPQTG